MGSRNQYPNPNFYFLGIDVDGVEGDPLQTRDPLNSRLILAHPLNKCPLLRDETNNLSPSIGILWVRVQPDPLDLVPNLKLWLNQMASIILVVSRENQDVLSSCHDNSSPNLNCNLLVLLEGEDCPLLLLRVTFNPNNVSTSNLTHYMPLSTMVSRGSTSSTLLNIAHPRTEINPFLEKFLSTSSGVYTGPFGHCSIVIGTHWFVRIQLLPGCTLCIIIRCRSKWGVVPTLACCK